MDYSYIILAAVAGLVIGMVFALARRGRGSSRGAGAGYAGAPVSGGRDGREGDVGASGSEGGGGGFGGDGGGGGGDGGGGGGGA